MQVVDDAVVHRSAKLRMRMQDDRDWRVLGFLRMIAAFEAAFRAGEDDFGHGFPLRVLSVPQILDEFSQGP